jgi:dUTP pyrophosphatase
MLQVKVKRLTKAAILPRYAHVGLWGDLAADLYACEAVTVGAGVTLAIPTGIALELPSDYGALVEDRSGLAMKGLTTLAGVIDPGYRGEIKVVLTNLGSEAWVIAAGDRVAQLRLIRRVEAVFEEVEELVDAPRGVGGFGSTGV